jgi:hypothetical protein
MKKTKNKIKENKETGVKKKIIWVLWTTLIMIIGLFLFKYIPMYLYGENILFDASSHVAWTTWGLYVLWLLVSPKRFWKVFYLLISAVLIVVMAIQRINIGAHNLIGVVLGFVITIIAIAAPRWNEFRKGVYF